MECEQIPNVLFFIYKYIDLTNIRHKLIPLFETDFCQVVGLEKRNEKFYVFMRNVLCNLIYIDQRNAQEHCFS